MIDGRLVLRGDGTPTRRSRLGKDLSCDTGSALFVARASMAVIGCLRVPLAKAARRRVHVSCSSVLSLTFDVHVHCLLLCAQLGRFDASGSFAAPGHVSGLMKLLCVTHCCEFMELPLGWEKGSPPPSPAASSTTAEGTSGGRGIARLPSSSHSRDGLLARLRGLRRRKDWHLSLPPHTAG